MPPFHRGALAIALVTVGCGEPLEFPDWTLPVPDGTPVIEYAGVPIGERDGSIGMVEDLVIGGAGSIPEALLYPRGYTANGVVLAGGTVLVLDSGNSRVAAFDPMTGGYLHSFGAEGQGPGEFQRAARLALVGDKVVVMDTGSQKLSYWAASGEHLEDVGAPALRQARAVAGLPDGTLVAKFTERREEESLFVAARFGSDGSEQLRYLEAPGPRFDLLELDGRSIVFSHQDAEVRLAVDGARIYVADAIEYQLLALDPDGNAEWALRTTWESVPYPASSIDEQVEQMREVAPSLTAGMINWPERLPTLAFLLVDGHGHLYVFPYEMDEVREQRGARAVDIYDRDGERLFSGFVARRWEAADGDFVYSYLEGEDSGEWRVVRYRLEEPFGS